jgi:hypothetical protein
VIVTAVHCKCIVFFASILAAATPGSGIKPPTKGVDLEAVGNINGVPVYEFDIDSLKVEDKPWRKPGEHIK